MNDLIIISLMQRFSSFLRFQEDNLSVCETFDIYHDAFFEKEYIVPKCTGKEKIEHVQKKEDWGYYKASKNMYHVLHIPTKLIVYHTCSEDSAQQMVDYLPKPYPMKINKTSIRKLSTLLRDFRPNFDVTYFASGLNVIGEFLGFTDKGINIGVAITYYDSKTGNHTFMKRKNIEYLRKLSSGKMKNQTYIPKIFVDSGEFSLFKGRMDYETGESKVKPKELDFSNIMKKYKALVKADYVPSNPSNFYFVAPDIIGDPNASLQKLQEYQEDILSLMSMGANIIIPLHDTEQFPSWIFDEHLEEMFGKDTYIRGIPSKSEATKLSRLTQFLKIRQPKAVHFLGMGLTGNKYRPFTEAIKCFSPHTQIYLDAVRLTALIGRAKDKKGKTLIDEIVKIRGKDKIYTQRRDEAEAELIQQQYKEKRQAEIEMATIQDDLSHWISLEEKLKLDFDTIQNLVSDADGRWLDIYLPDSNVLQDKLYAMLDGHYNYDDYFDTPIIKNLIEKYPSIALEITNDAMRYKNLLDFPIEDLAKSSKYARYTKQDIDPEIDEKIQDIEENYEDEINEEGIWNDWFFNQLRSFPSEVLKELRNKKSEALAKKEFYAQKTKLAISKLTDKDLGTMRKK